MSSSLKLGYGCAICSDTFTVNDERNICTIRQCGHVYHEYCVKRWFSTQISQGTQSNCPKCRKPATENQIIRLFLHETVASDNDVTLNDDNAHDIPDDAIVESDGDFAAQLNRQIILEQLTRPSQLEIDTVPGHHERFNNDEYDALIEEFGTIFNDGFDATAGNPTSSLSHHNHAHSLNEMDQRLQLMNWEVSAMTAMVDRLQSYMESN